MTRKYPDLHDRMEALAILAEIRMRRIEKQQAEIERLRGDLAAMSDSVAVAAQALNDEERENERLRSERNAYSNSLTGEALPEIDRLRRLLLEAWWHRNIGNTTDYSRDLWDRVR
ncbi:MAG: hypothetical protein NHG36_17350, partial [Chromatiaceae bacterium]|nr:hypothetical protein [Candidatus Thioaporhodococcus sediminis]